MVLPLTYIFVLTFLIPEYYTIRVINYVSETNRNTDQLIIERFSSESCEGEESVSFKSWNLTKIPATAIKSKTIKHVNVQENLLDRIPTELFDNVPSLDCLNVAMNKIPYEEIFNFGHSTLKTLIVDGQIDIDHFNVLQLRLLNYPKAHFPKLEMLHANGISTFVLDLFPKDIFPQLTTLYLTTNKLRNIDKDFISNLPTSLQHLHLERNDISKFNVYSLGNLISLFLDENPLEIIDINSNATLQVLSLRDCRLISGTLEYLADNPLYYLEILDLSQNHLVYIPDNLFESAKHLQILLLSNNSITEIPKINKFQRLDKLSLSYNNIAIVTNLISNTLTILNLQNNEISRITDSSFQYLPSLEELDLSNNKLEYLAPGWAHGLKNLKQLNLRFNMFTKIVDMSLTSLFDLQKLFIRGNLFHEMDEHEIQVIPQTCTTYVT